jgi:outer membrane receptor for Fe3+-dicitrate
VYSINVDANAKVLVVSYVSYATQKININGKSVVDVKLVAESITSNEVVVIGYGSVKRKDLTGSVASVNMTDLIKAPVKSFDDALAGRVTGVQVTSPDGMPGASPTIVIRG